MTDKVSENTKIEFLKTFYIIVLFHSVIMNWKFFQKAILNLNDDDLNNGLTVSHNVMKKRILEQLNQKIILIFILIFLSFESSAQCYLQISSKYDQVAAIDNDSNLWIWGGGIGWQRKYSIPHKIDSSKNWKQVSTGENFLMALKSDGTLWGLGGNLSGQLGNGTTFGESSLTRVTQDSNWIAVSCGEEFTVAIKSDSTVWAWGINRYGQLGQGTNRTNSSIPIQIGTQSNYTTISSGKYLTVLKDSNNKLWHVGACYSTTDVSQITQVGSASNWDVFTAGHPDIYAIKLNGSLWKFTSTNGRPTGLTQIGSSPNWEKVDQSLLIKSNGTLWGYGGNSFGQLGTGGLNGSATPVQIGIDNDWENIVSGESTSFAVKVDGSFWAWGKNNHAQFGNGKNKSKILPINSSASWKDVSNSNGSFNDHVSAIKTDGTLWSWGLNGNGQLGDGTQFTTQYLPVQAGSDTNWSSISNGYQFSISIKSDGTLWGWGRNLRGQLGLGYTSFNVLSPLQIGLDSNWQAVVTGSNFSLGLKKDSTLWSWGHNSDGQLGNGQSGNSLTLNTPTQIGTDSNWVFVAAGNNNSVAIKADSTLWTWGNSSFGKLGRTGNFRIPQLVDSAKKFTYVSCSITHTLAIDDDSLLWGCGSNNDSQLGISATNNQLSLVKVDSNRKWIKIVAGSNHSLGIISDSTLWAWGSNFNGQLGDSVTYVYSPFELIEPTLVSSEKWSDITTGNNSSFAIHSNGEMYSMGDPQSISNYPLIARTQLTPILINSCSLCESTDTSLSKSICQRDSLLFGGVSLSASGTYKDTLMTLAGCDSIVTLNLNVYTNSTSSDVISACNSYEWINGITYTQSDSTAKDTLSNRLGCDSIISLRLSITNIDTSVAVSGFALNSNETGARYQWLDCNNSYSILVGDTLQSYTSRSSGSYAVEVSKNGCIDTSECQFINIVGLSENTLLSSVNLFPNPTSKDFQLVLSKNLNTKVTIIDSKGRIIETRIISEKSIEQFSLESVSKGIYLVRIENNRESVLFKLIKE